jgi:hypothetical protein
MPKDATIEAGFYAGLLCESRFSDRLQGRESNMRDRFSNAMMAAAMAGAAAGALMLVSSGAALAQGAQAKAPGASAAAPALKTPWGDPDLQGIWLDETDTPLQRPARYGNQEFFTEAQRTELNTARANLGGKDNRRERGTELDVTGSYNDLFISRKYAGARTSKIMDPPDGRIPALTPSAAKTAGAEREFRLALLQATETCKIEYRSCAGGKYDPTPSPRFLEQPPRYNLISINRHDGPEDGASAVRCLTAGLPAVGGARTNRIVQTAGGIAMFYDVGQGQGWQRNIVMNGNPHLPAGVRQWYGDSRGHWDGNTLVIDVTNFTAKTDFQGSRENLHLVERYTRTGPDTLEWVVTIEDPTVWTKPWTVTQEFTLQNGEANRIYYEPRCNEGNYALPGLLRGARMADTAYAEGRAPHPATRDSGTGISGAEDDPLNQ